MSIGHLLNAFEGSFQTMCPYDTTYLSLLASAWCFFLSLFRWLALSFNYTGQTSDFTLIFFLNSWLDYALGNPLHRFLLLSGFLNWLQFSVSNIDVYKWSFYSFSSDNHFFWSPSLDIVGLLASIPLSSDAASRMIFLVIICEHSAGLQ